MAKAVAYILSCTYESYAWGTTEGIEVTVERDELYAALRKVEPLLGDRPERRYLRVDAAEGLALSTADRDQLVTACLAADVSRPGLVIAYGRFLIEFVRHAPQGKVTLRATDPDIATAQVNSGLIDAESAPLPGRM